MAAKIEGFTAGIYGFTHGLFSVGFNLALGRDGNIYGVGNTVPDTSGTGFIFRFTPAGNYSKLVSFPSFPAHGEQLPLVAASDGNL